MRQLTPIPPLVLVKVRSLGTKKAVMDWMISDRVLLRKSQIEERLFALATLEDKDKMS